MVHHMGGQSQTRATKCVARCPNPSNVSAFLLLLPKLAFERHSRYCHQLVHHRFVELCIIPKQHTNRQMWGPPPLSQKYRLFPKLLYPLFCFPIAAPMPAPCYSMRTDSCCGCGGRDCASAVLLSLLYGDSALECGWLQWLRLLLCCASAAAPRTILPSAPSHINQLSILE